MTSAVLRRRAPKEIVKGLPPRPWSVWDPNGEWCERERGGAGYRPISILDARGNRVAYVGERTRVLKTAQHIVACVNKCALAKIGESKP